VAQMLKQAPKVLIVSNQQTTTGALSTFSLQQQKYSVVSEPTAANAVERWAQEQPDLIILDINFPKDLILQLVKALREETVTPIVLITRGLTEEDLLEAYEAGVDECLIKPVSPSIFLAKIRVWLRRSRSAPAEELQPLRVGILQLLPAERGLKMGKDQRVHLTNLEMRLLYSLMSRPRHTVTAEELIQQVWGEADAADSAMLKALVYRLRHKIELHSGQGNMIRTVAGQGYLFAPP